MAGFDFMELEVAQHAQVQRREVQEENSARLAFSRHLLTTKGATSRRLSEPILFEVGFTEPPFFGYGAAILDDPDPGLGWVPETSGGVWKWHRNTKGQYTGAYVYLSVRSSVSAMSSLTMQHHLTFSGVAYKDLGQEAATEAELLVSRPVNLGGI